jgi:hypothetical protein
MLDRSQYRPFNFRLIIDLIILIIFAEIFYSADFSVSDLLLMCNQSLL